MPGAEGGAIELPPRASSDLNASAALPVASGVVSGCSKPPMPPMPPMEPSRAGSWMSGSAIGVVLANAEPLEDSVPVAGSARASP